MTILAFRDAEKALEDLNASRSKPGFFEQIRKRTPEAERRYNFIMGTFRTLKSGLETAIKLREMKVSHIVNKETNELESFLKEAKQKVRNLEPLAAEYDAKTISIAQQKELNEREIEKASALLDRVEAVLNKFPAEAGRAGWSLSMPSLSLNKKAIAKVVALGAAAMVGIVGILATNYYHQELTMLTNSTAI